jgi:voltage-gated potassium channel Kch
VLLNPPMDTVIAPDHAAIFIAKEPYAIRIEAESISVDMSLVARADPPRRRPERTLLLGWNRRAPIIARELSRYVVPGSLLTVAADVPDLEARVRELDLRTGNLAIEYAIFDTARRETLEALNIASYDHVLVLGYATDLPPHPSDTRTLVTLLHLRHIAEALGTHVNVVSEMIDVRNRELAEVTRADDFVVSNRLVSQMLAQASESENLSAVFDELLDERGSEFYMRRASNYVALERPVTFYTIVEAARRRGEIAVGYSHQRRENADPDNPTGVVMNPKKSDLVTFSPGDRVIVLARGQGSR